MASLLSVGIRKAHAQERLSAATARLAELLDVELPAAQKLKKPKDPKLVEVVNVEATAELLERVAARLEVVVGNG